MAVLADNRRMGCNTKRPASLFFSMVGTKATRLGKPSVVFSRKRRKRSGRVWCMAFRAMGNQEAGTPAK